MVRLCALLRAILMKINSISSKRKRMSRVYNYLLALLTSMKDFELIDDKVVIKVSFDTKYAISKEGTVFRVKGKRFIELSEVDELEAMKMIEELILEKAKALGTRIGLNVERILNPPKRPKKPKPKKEKTKQQAKR